MRKYTDNTEKTDRRGFMPNVFPTAKGKHYQFPTHVNDLIIDRAQAKNSEVFIVVLKPGQAPPLHRHPDVEQVFYLISGRGTLVLSSARKKFKVRAGDAVLIPPATWHTIQADAGVTVRYFAVDCFGGKRNPQEPTWDRHVRVVCREQGWDYKKIVKSRVRCN